MTLRFDQSTRARYRAALLRKGGQIAGELAEILGGKKKRMPLGELPAAAQKPGMKPEERLRAYLEHVEACRRRLDAEDDAFGRCRTCNQDLGSVVLDQMPWADRCQECAPKPG